MPPILKNKLDGVTEALNRLVLRSPLAVRAGNFRRVGDKPSFILLNNDVAFDMLIAKGWTSKGGILWRHDCSELVSVANFNPNVGSTTDWREMPKQE